MDILPFLKGLDISNNDSNSLNYVLKNLNGLVWLKANNIKLSAFPDFSNQKNLDSLYLQENNIESIPQKLNPNLRYLNLKKNNIKDDIDNSLFESEELCVLDLSFNKLTQIPIHIINSTLQILNLSHNSIKQINPTIFNHLRELTYLNLSDNNLELIPITLKKCKCLKTLILSNNPLQKDSFKFLPHLTSLRKLEASNTGRTSTNIPTDLIRLTNLTELNLSDNALTFIPDQFFDITNLERVDLAQNHITLISTKIDNWKRLKVLNLRSNKIRNLTSSLFHITTLNRLYLDDNLLTGDSFHHTALFSQMVCLKVISLTDNPDMREIPENLYSCPVLNDIRFNNNTSQSSQIDHSHLECDNNSPTLLPKDDKISLMPTLATEDPIFSLKYQLSKLPKYHKPKTDDQPHHIHELPYVINEDRDLMIHLQSITKIEENETKSTINSKNARKSSSWDYDDTETVLGVGNSGAEELDYSLYFDSSVGSVPGIVCWEIENFVPVRVDASLYGIFYDSDCYLILHTTYYDSNNGDRFDGLVGHNDTNNTNYNSLLRWSIYYWIGKHASLDKQACAAMHSVNLRNYLRSPHAARTQREEQGEESEAFIQLFTQNGDCGNSEHFDDNNNIHNDKHQPRIMSGLKYVAGSRTASGFFTIPPKQHAPRLYECSFVGNTLLTEPVPLIDSMIRSSGILILDAEPRLIYLWKGDKVSSVHFLKSRLLVEKMINVERKKIVDNCVLQVIHEAKDKGSEHAKRFLSYFERSAAHIIPEINEIVPTTKNNIKHGNHLYQVSLGIGFLEITQVKTPKYMVAGGLDKSCLKSNQVYILDRNGFDVYVWIGLQANRLLRTAAYKLATSLVYKYRKRPPYIHDICHLFESHEDLMFKTSFSGWNDVIRVDHSQIPCKSRETSVLPDATIGKQTPNKENGVVESGRKNYHHDECSSLLANNSTPNPEPDIEALFRPKQDPIPYEKAIELINEWNAEMDSTDKPLQAFVLHNKSFVKLPEEEFGHFFSESCYAFICNYRNAGNNDDDVQTSNNHANDNRSAEVKNCPANDTENVNEPYSIVYFWQGRDASNLGWLIFTFGMAKTFEQLFAQKKEALKICKELQQQETPKFLSLFHRCFIIHRGSRRSLLLPRCPASNSTSNSHWSVFQVRTNNNTAFYTRCIEIEWESYIIGSVYCYLFVNPTQRKIYVWHGCFSTSEDQTISQTMAQSFGPSYEIGIYSETEFLTLPLENIFSDCPSSLNRVAFLNVDKEWEYVSRLRLFRCSNDQGYFRIVERSPDFCQADLCDEDVMVLDDGTRLFTWIGGQSSELELRYTLKSLQVLQEFYNSAKPNQQQVVSSSSLSSGTTAKKREICIVVKGLESQMFKRCFHAWRSQKSEPNKA